MELTPKQQTSEAIKAAETVLITAGRQPTADQTAAAVALAMVLRKLNKKVTALISDKAPVNLDFLPLNQLDRNFSGLRDFVLKIDLAKTEVDKLRYAIEDGKLNVYVTPFKGGFAPSDVTFAYGDFHYDVIIVLGVPSKSKIDKAFEQVPQMLTNVPVINIDFHRSNENYGAINLIEPTAASLSEMLVSLSESLQNGVIDEKIATALLTGIIASTDRFTAQHTTPKALTVAAQLMAAGAKQQQVVKALYKGGRPDNRDGRGERHDKPAPKPTPRPTEATPQPEATKVDYPQPESQPQAAIPAELNDQAVSEMEIDPRPYDGGSGSILADEPIYNSEPKTPDANYINANHYWS